MFKELHTEKEFKECRKIIRNSFRTVAEDLNLTEENAPSHPSFITLNKINDSIQNGVIYTGLFKNDWMHCNRESKRERIFLFRAVLCAAGTPPYGIREKTTRLYVQ